MVDLSVSPDLDAFYCYAITLVAGSVVAAIQVQRRLGAFRGSWLMAETWLLFLAYVAVPVALFWLLDRTGAVRDTSLFAALLVGIGYQQILTGQQASLTAPSDISRLWQPFVAWAERVKKRVVARIRKNEERFREHVVSRCSSSSEHLAELRRLAMGMTADTAALQQQLQTIEGQRDALGEEGVLERQARALYEEATGVDDFLALMHRRGIASSSGYYWYGREWRSRWRTFLAVAPLLAAAYLAPSTLAIAPAASGIASEWRIQYPVWRLSRDDTSALDRFRTHERLVRLLTGDGTAEPTADQIARVVRRPGVPADVVDGALGLLLETRRQVPQARADALPQLLVHALRTQNPDARAPVHDALYFLAEELDRCPGAIERPERGAGRVRVEELIQSWERVWGPAAPRAPCPAPPPVPDRGLPPAAAGGN